MSPFLLEFPQHALARMRERKISRSFIRKAIIQGELVAVKGNGREIRQMKIKNRILEVIYLRRIGGFILVTCYWEGKFP